MNVFMDNNFSWVVKRELKKKIMCVDYQLSRDVTEKKSNFRW